MHLFQFWRWTKKWIRRPQLFPRRCKLEQNFPNRSIPEFTEECGPAVEIYDIENPTPLGIFSIFISMKLLEDILSIKLICYRVGKIIHFIRYWRIVKIYCKKSTHAYKKFTKLQWLLVHLSRFARSVYIPKNVSSLFRVNFVSFVY